MSEIADSKLNSAEGVTRYLRSRDITSDDLVKYSNLLLDDELDVYLPNRRTFILELVSERLSDSKFARLRNDHRIWQLLYRSFESLQSESKIRNRLLQNFKVGDAIISALEKDETIEKDLYESILQVIHLIRSNVSINNLYDQSVPILSALLKALLKNDEISIDANINEIIGFFNSSVSTEKFTKKFTNSFISNALPAILQTIESTTTDSSRQLLFSLSAKIILNKDQQESFLETTKLLLKSKVTGTAMVTYFKFIVGSLPRLQTAKIEELYSEILKTFPETSEDLLDFISRNNRALSSPFLQSIFGSEISKDIINWNLIRSILKLDIEVGLKNSEMLMSYLEDEDYQDYFSVISEIINAFLRSRYLFNFFQLWYKLLENKKDSKYRSDDFQKLVSTYIHNFSATQLSKLIQSVGEQTSTNKYVVLNGIVQGIFTLKDKTMIGEAEFLLRDIIEVDSDDSDFWKLRYQVLTLYDKIISHDDLLAIAKNTKFTSEDTSMFKYFTIFRIRETIEFDVTSVFSQFLAFATRVNKRQPALIEYAFKRWFVLVNQFLSREQIQELVALLLSSDNGGLLAEVFLNDEFFEQSKISDTLLKQIFEKIKIDANSFDLELLKLIPFSCYPKWLKPTAIETLTRLLKTDSPKILDTLINMLDKSPSFKTKIESEIKEIYNAIDEDSTNIELFKVIWNNHCKNHKESISSDYIAEAIEFITKRLEKRKTNAPHLSSEFYIALIILTSKSISPDQSRELRISFTESIKLLLHHHAGIPQKTEQDLNEISWLLLAINELNLNESDFASLHDSLKIIGKVIQNSEDKRFDDSKVKLFLLLARYSNESANLEYFESLYIVLRRSGLLHDDLKPGLLQVLKKVPIEKFNAAFEVCLRSLMDSADLGFIVEIVCCYWLNLFKSNEQAVLLFIKSISLISLHLKELSNEMFIIIVNGFKSMLTERAWLISQYGLETIIAILSKTVDLKLSNNSKFMQNNKHIEDLFIAVTLSMSNILLYHRYRLSNRHHLLVSIFKSLLKSLTNSNRHKKPNSLTQSKRSAQALTRLLSNLCEPSVSHYGNLESNSEKLNTGASLLKRGLRRHIHVLLLNYIHFALKYSYTPEVREPLLPGIFNIFDVLSQDELNLINTSLNNPGRTYFKALHDEYKKVGKWQVD